MYEISPQIVSVFNTCTSSNLDQSLMNGNLKSSKTVEPIAFSPPPIEFELLP